MAKDDSTKLTVNGSFTDCELHANLRFKSDDPKFDTHADAVMNQVGTACFKSLLPAIRAGLAPLKLDPGSTVETEDVDVSFNGISCRLTVSVKLHHGVGSQLDIRALIRSHVTEPAADLITELILGRQSKAPADVFDNLFGAADALLGGRVRAAKTLIDLGINPIDLLGGKKGLVDLFSSAFGTADTQPPRREPHGARPPHKGPQATRPATESPTQSKSAGGRDPHMM